MRRTIVVLGLALLVLGCGGDARGGAEDAATKAMPAVPPSVVFGHPDAPSGGTLVVGHVIDTPPAHRLVDLIGAEAYATFLREEAKVSAESAEEEVEESEEFDEVVENDGVDVYLWQRRTEFREAVSKAVLALTNVRVLFCDVLPTEVGGCAVVLDDESELLPNSRLPEEIAPLVRRCVEAIHGSPRVGRMAEDPREILEARREGADVWVRPRRLPDQATLQSLDAEVVAPVAFEPDGWLQVHAPEDDVCPVRHQIACRWTVGDLELRRAYTIHELVGMTERRVFAHAAAEVGASYAPHVLFTNDRTGEPVQGKRERLRLVQDNRVLAEAEAVSNAAGGLDVALPVPVDAKTGSATLEVGGEAFPLEIRSSLRLSVVTDRALYRPNDRICVRVMVHDAVHGRPVVGRDVVLKLESAEKRVSTSRHGVASTTFRLVDRRPGVLRIQGSIASTKASRRVQVQAYEAASFGVETQPRTLRLRPGETAPVRIVCRYMNQTPVVGASVTIRTSGHVKRTRSEATTDDAGEAAFAARLKLEGAWGTYRVVVRDADGRTEEATVHVVRAPPEEERDRVKVVHVEDLVAGLPGRVALHGRPSERLSVQVGGETREVVLDDQGQAVLPVETRRETSRVRIRRADGRETLEELGAYVAPSDQPVAAPARRVAALGDALPLRIVGRPGLVMVGVERDGVVLRAYTLRLGDEPRTLEVPLEDDLAGVLRIRAFTVGEKGLEGSSVDVLVIRDRALVVRARTEREAYRPGERVHVDVDVRDAEGRPTAAVLGYWGVDEALLQQAPWPDAEEDVFDLPGRSVSPLAAEAERGRFPGYPALRAALGTIRSVGPTSSPVRFAIQHRRSVAARETADQAARARARAACMEAREAWIAAYADLPLDEIRTASSLRESLTYLVERGYLSGAHLLDPWGTPLVLGHGVTVKRVYDRRSPSSYSWHERRGHPWCSAGPDRVLNSEDDVHGVWPRVDLGEIPGRLGRFLGYVEDVLRRRMADDAERRRLQDRVGPYTPFLGPMRNGLIGLGGGAGGAFRGRGGGRDIGGGGGGRHQPTWPEVYVRRDFEPTLCFVPEAIVGPEGSTRLEIPLRDSITTWRLRLVASSADGATGIGQGEVRVTQPLHAEPWVATHLTVGDVLEVPVAVRNETGAALATRVAASVRGGLELLGAPNLEVTVPPHGTGSAVFRIRAVRPLESRVRIDVRGGSHADAIERVVHVRRDARDEVETWHATLQAEKPWRPDLPAASTALGQEYAMRVYASPMATVIGGLDGLLTCPHG